ncbi:Exodeoxyribonuclease III [Streptomyces sp. RB5]|uniref:Exodeoxyribonuclease III n=1 Tax=Streptomyces smaragdinus TaxID=2585196 RepID=A0A7K0CM83_9ACTN|nr:exodeoxyribonuclease III [Streptomyces smaragdinus]MQY14585.1 Exodeoxyribonuclease III [Streptomyces smaragdinus]
MALRIATWNVNSITTRLDRITGWLRSTDPDVVCLQELKCTPEAFPTAPLRALGYEAAFVADGRWNGAAVLSRVGLEDITHHLPDQPQYDGVTEPRAVGATCGPVRVWSLYVPNGREVGHAHYAYKLKWLEALRAAVATDAAGSRPFAVLGDFNVAPKDEDVWDISLFEGATHVSEAERTALIELQKEGLSEVYPRALKYDIPFTFWDYRQLGFQKNKGMRIDHVYGNAPFTAAVTDSYVDREARRPGKKDAPASMAPSDHAPLVVDLEL